MIKMVKIFSLILDLLVLFSFLIFVASFNFKINIDNIINFILIFSITAFILKFFYWHLNDKNEINLHNKRNLFLFRLLVCIFLYITPTYYILQFSKLVINNYVISITLIIISILAFTAVISERFNWPKKT